MDKPINSLDYQSDRTISRFKSPKKRFEIRPARSTFFVAFCVKSLQILSVCRLFVPSYCIQYQRKSRFS